MTEQEKKIEELGSYIEKLKCGKYHDCSSCHMKDYMFCQSAKLGKDLYDVGYRKADEVRKETAIEYSNKVDEIVDWCISNKIGDDFDYEYFTNCLRNLKKEFGVEVEA